MLARAIRLIERIESEGLSETLKYGRHCLSENYYEWRLGIESSGYVERKELGVENPLCVDYAPTDYRSLKSALNHLDIRPDRDVFIDYGSGKGRVAIVAATYPFRRIIGVEISPALNAIAGENVRRARKKLKCANIELVTDDASHYSPPDDVSVVFLYHPFSGDIISAVVQKIRQSLLKNPRRLTLLYRYPSWVENIFSRCDWLNQRWEIPCYSKFGERFLIYETP
ncbi:MAG: class I SAM-dependent methyltransferase [Deltaproteobacteria bacterium]|nr:class I SAM-dependent methyltransferase [Deltaproteobacteria bacterium]